MAKLVGQTGIELKVKVWIFQEEKSLTVRTTRVIHQRHVHGDDSRAGTRTVRRRRALLLRALEKVVLQRVKWRYPRFRVVVQHVQDKIFEFQIIGHGMTELA